MLLHNSIPHDHENDFSQLQLKKSEISCCLAIWFKSVLQLDFGEEHLEVFNQIEKTSFNDNNKVDLGMAIIPSWLTINEQSGSIENEIRHISSNPFKEYNSSTCPDRGPPKIS